MPTSMHIIGGLWFCGTFAWLCNAKIETANGHYLSKVFVLFFTYFLIVWISVKVEGVRANRS